MVIKVYDMKLIRFGNFNQEKPGVILSDGVKIDVSGFIDDYNEFFFENNGIKKLKNWVSKNKKNCPKVGDKIRLGAPICRPSKIVCIGLNYKKHAIESGMGIPVEPVIFFKSTTAIVGPYDNVIIPNDSKKTDWEVELAIVIKKKCFNITRSESDEYIAGYLIHNDISERSYQLERGGQWVKGKSYDSFAPLGPYLVTKDEIKNPNKLKLWLKLNNITMQNSSTKDFIFDINDVISYVSRFMTLLPGDIISTGTPSGVGLGQTPPLYLKNNDIMELGIEGLGISRQICKKNEN